MTIERLRRAGVSAALGALLAMLGVAPASAFASTRDHWLHVEHGAEGRYVTGGVGIDERHALAQLARGYDLELGFATRGGDYLNYVTVTVTNGRGHEVISTRTQGPLLYARLPPGRYRVVAEVDGRRLTHTVDVAAGGRAYHIFHWPGRGEIAPAGGRAAG